MCQCGARILFKLQRYIYPCRRQMLLRYLWHPKPKPFFQNPAVSNGFIRPCSFGTIFSMFYQYQHEFQVLLSPLFFPERARRPWFNSTCSYNSPVSMFSFKKKQKTCFFPLVETSLVLHVASRQKTKSSKQRTSMHGILLLMGSLHIPGTILEVL